MKKKKGFTLVELLAVIVILAVILVMAVPQIMSVIESARKGSIESTAKLIAEGAEREYTNRKILGKDTNIECSDVSSMNSNDYGTCVITFDNRGKATVKVTGKGKFEGYTCNGNSTNMECTKNGNVSEYKKASEYIKELYDDTSTRTENGLKKDNTRDENIRYEGSNPNNYVKFNDELWRIIGVFGNNVKLIRSENIGELGWDSSDEEINR